MSEINYKFQDIVDVAKQVYNFARTNKTCPEFITINGNKQNRAEYLRLAIYAILQCETGDKSNIIINRMDVSNPTAAQNVKQGNYTKQEYISHIRPPLVGYMDTYLQNPVLDTISLGTMNLNKMVVVYSYILYMYTQNGNKLPESIVIEPTSYPTDIGGTSFTSWYNSMIGAGYEGYDSDVYSSAEEDYNIIHKISMNCTDYSQKAKEKAEAWGYEWRYIHRICASNKGHILGQIKGREFSDWTYIDVAAAASIGSKYPIGKSWCENYKSQWISTEQWLMNNDGEFVK